MRASFPRCTVFAAITLLTILLFLTQTEAHAFDATSKRLVKRWRRDLDSDPTISPPGDGGLGTPVPGDGGNQDDNNDDNNDGGSGDNENVDPEGRPTRTRTETVTVTPSDPAPPPPSSAADEPPATSATSKPDPPPSEPSASNPPADSSEPLLGLPLPSLTLSVGQPPKQTFVPNPRAYLTAHNSVRASVGAPPLEWSNELASNARTWVELCLGRTSGGLFGQVGENMVAGTGLFSEADAVAAWTNEPYDPFNPVGSHYTQAVWKSTQRIGCASVSCPGLLNGRNARLHMCQYDPPGNILGFFGDNVVA